MLDRVLEIFTKPQMEITLMDSLIVGVLFFALVFVCFIALMAANYGNRN